MKIKKPAVPTVISISRAQLTICGVETAGSASVKFPPTAFRDLEVTNRVELITFIHNFLTSRQVKPAPVIIIFSPDTYFEKDLTGIPSPDKAAQAQGFIDTIPLNSVSAKTFHSHGTERLIVINREFYDCLREALVSHGSTVLAVVPAFALSVAGVKDDYSPESCRLIVKKADTIMENSFTVSEETFNSPRGKEQRFLKAHSQMFIIISVMFLIFSVVMVIIISSRRNAPAPAKNLTSPGRTDILRPSATPSPTPEATSSAQFSVNILNGSGETGLAARLQTDLETLGLENFRTGNAPAPSARTLVVFSSRVPAPLREELVSLLEKDFSSVSSSENAAAQFDINITTGPVRP